MASTSFNGFGFGFFRIIFRETLERKMLELPKKFVRLFGENLSTTVSLSPPNGSKWKLGLEKRDDEVWLQQGWPDFVKHYSLGFGHLLFFTYRGNSEFQLTICDLSTCEVYYPSLASHPEQHDVNGSIGDELYSQCFRAGKNSSTRDEQKKYQGAEIKIECISDDDFGMHQLVRVEEASKHPQRKGAAKKGKSKGKSAKSKSRNQTAPARATRRLLRNSEAFEAASKFFSRKPFFKSTVTCSHNMRLPASFVKRHMEQKPQNIRLEVGTRSWLVRFLDCNAGNFLCGGYSKFLRENSLGRGDVCIYELNGKISRSEVVLKVSIFRCSNRQGRSTIL